MVTTRLFEIVETKDIAPRVRHIGLRPLSGDSFVFTPGQFVTVHFERGGKAFKRSYSIASIQEKEPLIAFAASYVAHGPGSEYLFALQVGDRAELSGPFGRLVLKEELLTRLLLISTGTGVTPYRAMLPTLSKKMVEHPDLHVIIMQGAQYRQDLLYLDDFLDWAQEHSAQAEYRAYLSREDLEKEKFPYEYRGYVQSSFAELNILPDKEAVYLCGNPNMIDDAFVLLQHLGMPTAQIRREKYISSK